MSDYTVTLRYLIYRGFNPFDDSWTTFIPEHKPELCDKIIRAYNFYNIGQETPEKFRYYLNEHLARKMPYWNKLYESALIKIIPEYNQFVEVEGKDVQHNGRNLTKVSRDDISQIKQMAQSLQALIDGTLGATSVTGVKGHENWQETKTGDKTGEYHETGSADTDGKKDSTAKETFTSKETSVGEENTTGSENQTGSNTGHKTTEGSQQTSSNATKRYSETPEGYVTAGGVNIDSNYLTNYTSENGNTNGSSSQSEDVTNTDKRDTDTTGKKDTSGTVDVSSTKDTTYGETSTENTDTKKDGTTGEDWQEKTVGSKDSTSDTDVKEDEQTSTSEHRFQNGSERDNISKLETAGEDEKEKRESSKKIVTKGFTISQASLIMEYRKSIIDVDQIIIDDLGCNFMGVF